LRLTVLLNCVLMQFRFCVCPAWASYSYENKNFLEGVSPL
jgi:hypothetical protein